MLQNAEELDEFFRTGDPWGYEENLEDSKRKDILLSEIPKRSYGRVLDIGCGHGFVTRDLPGKSVTGVDISAKAVEQASKAARDGLSFVQGSMFGLSEMFGREFDLVVITGVLYPQYIGNSLNLVYHITDNLLKDGGVLVSVHINQWYRARFPYLLLKEYFYPYREYTHRLEVYVK